MDMHCAAVCPLCERRQIISSAHLVGEVVAEVAKEAGEAPCPKWGHAQVTLHAQAIRS